jgi:hypothetical protein
MKLKSILVLAILFASDRCMLRAAEMTDASFESFKRTLITTAGPDGLSCGEVARQNNSTEAFKCARDALKSGASFWVVAQKHAGDPRQWVGAARDDHGVLYQIHFDPPSIDKSGTKSKAKFTIDHCSSLKFDDEANRILCVPSTR